MKQVARVISTYTADVSGVCSALYELGGMVVMHDPSGCNSTYNTHDEPRWYHMDSLIFISGLAEMDAIMGNDDKLIDDVVEAANQLHPRFVALARTPIPMMNGTDFDAICRVITHRTGIPAFYFPTNGTHSYIYGAGLALEKIAEYYVKRPKITKNMSDTAEPLAGKDSEHASELVKMMSPVRINLLGVTPLDFSVNETLSSVRQWIRSQGWEVGCCLAMGSSLDEIAASGDADVNLVLSTVGLRAAKRLERTCNIPYVVGFPVGKYAEVLAEDIRQTAADGRSRVSCTKRGDRRIESSFRANEIGRTENRFCESGIGRTESSCLEAAIRKNETSPSDRTVDSVIIGEAVVAGSLAAAMEHQTGKWVRLICPLETESELLAAGDLRESDEDGLTRALISAKEITADPMYRPICPAGAVFHELPHEAFSGRIYRKRMPDLTNYIK